MRKLRLDQLNNWVNPANLAPELSQNGAFEEDKEDDSNNNT